MNFQSATASIIGSSHKKRLINKQDAYRVLQRDGALAAVVSDGCGSCPEAEVGAILTAEFVVNYCITHFNTKPFNGPQLCEALCSYYDIIVKGSGSFFPANFTRDTLLATVVGCFITPSQAVTFSAGDGVIVVNDELTIIDQNDRPEFLAYNIYRDRNYGFTVKSYEPDAIERILIATDGILDLTGDENALLVIDGLFANEEYFSDPASLPKFIVDQTELRDDTTLVMLKR